jgi:hypothetical protein
MLIEAKRSLAELEALTKVVKAQYSEAFAIAEPLIVASGESDHTVAGCAAITYVEQSDSMSPHKGACVARLIELGETVPSTVVTRKAHCKIKLTG